jgi:DNA-binding transcriptional MerR regulator
VQAGASPTKIAQAVSLKKLSTPERILGHRYLRLTEQVDEHQAARRRFLELKQNREEPVERMLAHIGSLLGDYAVSRLKQLGNPSKGYALSYRLRSRNGGLSLPELETRFAEYFCAAQEESLPAIDELAERIGVSQTTLSAFLRKGHLTTLKRPNFHRSSSHLASSRSEEITKAYDLGMTAGDASHFLDLPHHSVIKEYKKLQMDNRPKKSRHPFLKILASQEKLTYAKASKIYEASDLGFEPHEVAELVEASPEMVEHAQSERQNIGDQITFYLSSMVGKEFKQPYPSAEPSQ